MLNIGVDARWLFSVHPSPHVALIEALLLENRKKPLDVKFFLYTNTQETARNDLLAENVIIKNLSGVSSVFPDFFWFNIRIRNSIKRDGVELFFSPYYKIPIFASIPCVNMIHDASFCVLPPEFLPIKLQSAPRRIFLRCSMNLYSRLASKTLTVSAYSRECLITHVGLARNAIAVCYNPVDVALYETIDPAAVEKMREKYHLPRKYYLYVGSSLEKKNLKRLVRAYNDAVSATGNDSTLVLKTDSSHFDGEMKHLVGQSNGVQIISDKISYSDVAHMICGSSGLFLVSFDEGFGIPAIEAMAAGVPVVLSDVAALREVGGPVAIYVDPFSVRSIADSFRKLFGLSSSERELYSKNGKARAKIFSSSRVSHIFFTALRDR